MVEWDSEVKATLDAIIFIHDDKKHSKRVIGIPTTRSEGREKVSGAAIYATDVVLPNMLWAKALRSPIRLRAHSRKSMPVKRWRCRVFMPW